MVLPDIVGGGLDSLALSVSWIPKLRTLKNLLLPLQDGMDAEAVGSVLREHRNVGLFLGGTTEFKLREIYAWGMVAASWRRWYHVGRVNTARRIRLCAEAGATSFGWYIGNHVLLHGSALVFCQKTTIVIGSRPSVKSSRGGGAGSSTGKARAWSNQGKSSTTSPVCSICL